MTITIERMLEEIEMLYQTANDYDEDTDRDSLTLKLDLISETAMFLLCAARYHGFDPSVWANRAVQIQEIEGEKEIMETAK